MIGIDYDVWAYSPSTGQEQRPKFIRSAINEKEAKDQAEELIEELKKETGILDWIPKWRKEEFETP